MSGAEAGAKRREREELHTAARGPRQQGSRPAKGRRARRETILLHTRCRVGCTSGGDLEPCTAVYPATVAGSVSHTTMLRVNIFFIFKSRSGSKRNINRFGAWMRAGRIFVVPHPSISPIKLPRRLGFPNPIPGNRSRFAACSTPS